MVSERLTAIEGFEPYNLHLQVLPDRLEMRVCARAAARKLIGVFLLFNSFLIETQERRHYWTVRAT